MQQTQSLCVSHSQVIVKFVPGGQWRYVAAHVPFDTAHKPAGGGHDCTGAHVGLVVGDFVGLFVGLAVGAFVGLFVGLVVGAFVGLFVGALVGDRVGLREGLRVGDTLGLFVGLADGDSVITGMQQTHSNAAVQ